MAGTAKPHREAAETHDAGLDGMRRPPLTGRSKATATAQA